MTEKRHDGTTARRRVGQRRGSLRAAATAGPRPVAAGEPAVTAAAPVEKPAPAGKAGMTKYTALLDDATALAFDELALVARRKLGRKVDKSQLFRTLVLLANDDASLRDTVIDMVGRDGAAG